MSEDFPVFDSSLPYEMVQGDEPTYYVQNDCIFDHLKNFKYYLKDDLKPSEVDNNAGYKVQILETPEPIDYEVEEISCPVCDYKGRSRFQVSRHCANKHGQSMSDIEKKKNKRG